MFDLEEFYAQCESGNPVDDHEALEYMKSFARVVIWGAAGLGQAIGRKLEECQVPNIIYWDERYKEMGSVNGRKIEAPFSAEYDRETTLIMYAIPNHVIMSKLMQKIADNGYLHVIRGDVYYSGTLCPYCNGDKPSAHSCWAKGECRSVICKRLQTITKNREKQKKPGERIDITYNCFIINSICNLNCMHCVQFINNYPLSARYNIPTENICRDIDSWLEMIDSAGTISVMGGETFMHPGIAAIAKKFSEHDNFGFVSFPTNGLFPIKPQQLEGIEDPWIVIAFGAYQHVATEKQLETYEKNVELVKSYGIAYTESRHLPTWVVPFGLYKVTDDEAYLAKRKAACLMPPRNLQIRDGKVHTCDRGVALYAMGVADYPSDYFVLDQELPLEKKRRRFREFVDRPFYHTCGHCGRNKDGISTIAPSAMQGIMNVFEEEAYQDQDWFAIERCVQNEKNLNDMWNRP